MSSQVPIDWSKLPNCARQCTTISDALNNCNPPKNSWSDDGPYRDCFCQIAAFWTGVALCDDNACSHTDGFSVMKYIQVDLCQKDWQYAWLVSKFPTTRSAQATSMSSPTSSGLSSIITSAVTTSPSATAIPPPPDSTQHCFSSGVVGGTAIESAIEAFLIAIFAFWAYNRRRDRMMNCNESLPELTDPNLEEKQQRVKRTLPEVKHQIEDVDKIEAAPDANLAELHANPSGANRSEGE